MKFSVLKAGVPSLASIILAFAAAVLLVLSFPDFDWWFLAYIALAPLLVAVEREKESFAKSFLTGWIFGTVFFVGSCWWLTFSLITYGGIPTPIAYLLLLIVAAMVGVFSAVFAGALSLILRKFGAWGILSAPLIWTATEFLRFYLTGNNWNALAYSQAFVHPLNQWASVGGIYLVGFICVAANSLYAFAASVKTKTRLWAAGAASLLLVAVSLININSFSGNRIEDAASNQTSVVAVQPNVPMGGMKYAEWIDRRDRHIELAEEALRELKSKNPASVNQKTIVVFPESPMNFGWTQDREFQGYLREFIRRHNVQVLINAAEPSENENFYNSALLVNERGEKIAQYDKIHLVPFGEFVPLPEPFAGMMPTMAGNFEFGEEYDIIPFGDAKAGIMICFESHFPTLSRQFVLGGADVLIEMTNDGYLGNTPVLRQHLASAVFRAVETNRPVLRATNVGITAYINERGEVSDELPSYTEGWRVWSVAESDGGQTFYVKYGDWFAWICSIGSLFWLILSLRKRKLSNEQI